MKDVNEQLSEVGDLEIKTYIPIYMTGIKKTLKDTGYKTLPEVQKDRQKLDFDDKEVSGTLPQVSFGLVAEEAMNWVYSSNMIVF